MGDKKALLLQGPIPLKPTSSLMSKASSSHGNKMAVPFNAENYNSFSVKVPTNRDVKKRHSIMKFNTKVDVSSISKAHMQRQKNTTEFKEEDMPKFGAGSEYGREQRLEAKRKKRGYFKKEVKDEDLPWLLKTGGRGGKTYKGVKEPYMVQNAAYYIFTQADDGSFEAYPVDSQYRFTPVINYRTLTADEAEEEFSLRNKTINYFSLMVKKRLTDTEEKAADEEVAIPKVKSKVDKLQLYNDDDLEDMSNEEGDDEQEHLDEEKFQKAKKKLGKTKKSGNEDNGSDFEEMEDGYEDSKEMDYSETSSSDEELDKKQADTKPQAEDDLNAQLNPDSEDDSELEEDRLSKGGLLLKDMLKQNDDSSDDEDDEEIDEDQTKSAVLLQGQKKKGKKAGSGSSTSSSSRSDTPTKGLETTDKTIVDAAKKLKDISSPARSGKKRSKNSPGDETPSKKARKDTESPIHRSASGSSLATRAVGETERPGSRGSPDVGITEEAVRRYLSHKPMTTKDLLKKFKTKKTGLSSEQTVQQIGTILKKLNPVQKMIKGKLFLSLKRS